MAQISPDVSSGPFTGNGSTTAFAFTFSIIASDHIRVTVNGTVVTTGFTVTFDDTTGTVTFAVAPAIGAVILLESNPDFSQTSSFANEGAYKLDTVNLINRRAAIRDLVLKDGVDRAITVPAGEGAVELPAAADRANTLMGFDEAGDLTLATGLPVGSVLDTLGSATNKAPSQRAVSSAVSLLAQPTTGLFYADAGAKIQRLDRTFIGAARANNGTNSGTQPDWLTTYLISKGRTFAFQQVATFAALTDVNPASNAILGGARTSIFTALGNAIGVLGVAVNDNTSYATGAYGGYFEGFQNAGAIGSAYGAEFDVINFKGTAVTDPYSQSATQVIGVQIAAGAAFAGTSDGSAAINIQNNGSAFLTGINFGADSLTGTIGGGTGTGTAIQMARGHSLRWFAAAATPTTQIYSISALTNNSTTVVFNENVTSFLNTGTTKGVFQVANVGVSGVNYPGLSNAATGAPVSLAALGDDMNIDILLSPKGTGVVRIGTWTTNADAAVNGYITVKDAAGTVRKLATIA